MNVRDQEFSTEKEVPVQHAQLELNQTLITQHALIVQAIKFGALHRINAYAKLAQHTQLHSAVGMENVQNADHAVVDQTLSTHVSKTRNVTLMEAVLIAHHMRPLDSLEILQEKNATEEFAEQMKFLISMVNVNHAAHANLLTLRLDNAIDQDAQDDKLLM